MAGLNATIAYMLAVNCGGVLAIGFLLLAFSHMMYRAVAAAVAQRWDA